MEEFLPLLKYISKYILLSADEELLLTKYLRIKHYKKRQFVVQPDFICKNMSFVIQGTLRAYLVDNTGKEHTIAFAIEDWWISDYSSFIYQEPATLFVEALDDCKLIQISYDNEQEFLKEIPKLEKFLRVITQRSLAFHQKRILSNFTQTAEERYTEFINKYPTIALRVPQYALASYLGFSTEYLSKLRNRKVKKLKLV